MCLYESKISRHFHIDRAGIDPQPEHHILISQKGFVFEWAGVTVGRLAGSAACGPDADGKLQKMVRQVTGSLSCQH